MSCGDWVLPGVIICSGTFLNTRFTKRLALILAWLTAFVLQASCGIGCSAHRSAVR